MENQKKVELSEEEISRFPSNIQEALRQGLPLNMIYRNLTTQYIRTKVPDKNLLAEYVVRAKGPERSLRQFAEEVGVNASTLSRIINKKTAGTNSDNLIADIAACADKNSGITFDMLMHAHGMENTVNGQSHVAYEREVGKSYKGIIIDALLKRGYTVALREPIRHKTISGGYRFDLEIVSNAIPRGDGFWGLEFYAVQAPRGNFQTGSIQYRGMGVLRRISRMCGLFADYSYNYDRVSVVVSDSKTFYEVTERLKDCYLKYEVTIILVDLETGEVDDEFMVPWIDETKCETVFTPLPEPDGEEPEEDDLWTDDYDNYPEDGEGN